MSNTQKSATKASMLRNYFSTCKHRNFPGFRETSEHMESKGHKLSTAQYYQIKKTWEASLGKNSKQRAASAKRLQQTLAASPAKQKPTSISDAGVSAIQFRDELAKLKLSMENKLSQEALAEACRSVFKV